MGDYTRTILHDYEYFCQEYLGLLKEKGVFDRITDGFVDIGTIRIGSPLKTLIFKKPKIKFDILEKQKEFIPLIKEISYNELMRLGYLIMSKVPKRKWVRGQSIYYFLEKINPFNRHTGVLNLPHNHKIEFDEANKRIRLVGKFISPQIYGSWINLKIKEGI